jgi:hypothetical protein
MRLEKQIVEELRDRLKKEKIKGYTLLDLNMGRIPRIVLVKDRIKATLDLKIYEVRLQDEIWELILSTPYCTHCRMNFSIYTVDLDRILHEMVEWIVFGTDKIVFSVGPQINPLP